MEPNGQNLFQLQIEQVNLLKHMFKSAESSRFNTYAYSKYKFELFNKTINLPTHPVY